MFPPLILEWILECRVFPRFHVYKQYLIPFLFCSLYSVHALVQNSFSVSNYTCIHTTVVLLCSYICGYLHTCHDLIRITGLRGLHVCLKVPKILNQEQLQSWTLSIYIQIIPVYHLASTQYSYTDVLVHLVRADSVITNHVHKVEILSVGHLAGAVLSRTMVCRRYLTTFGTTSVFPSHWYVTFRQLLKLIYFLFNRW